MKELPGIVFDRPIDALSQVFGYSAFRPGQEAIINNVMQHRDVLAIMMTSGGKSLCYQVPALCMPGTALVISPLISLMKDQVEALQANGVAAARLDSSLTPEQAASVSNNLLAGKLKLLYLSPERLSANSVLDILSRTPISFVAIDEAHCVSTWGEDFRPQYAKISDHLAVIERKRRARLPRIALTATATHEMRQDITSRLGLVQYAALEYSAKRDNLALHVVPSKDKDADLLALLKQTPGLGTIIYTATIKQAEKVYHDLVAHDFSVSYYHGRMPSGLKSQMQENFSLGHTNIMVATNAFGMGIDRGDIRQVIHYQMPGSIENYYQEVGRAGRDGDPASGFLLYQEADARLQEFLIDCNYPSPQVITGVRFLLHGLCDDRAITLAIQDICNYAPTTIKPNQVMGALRALEKLEILTILDYDATSESVTLTLSDAGVDLDMDDLHTKKQRQQNKLSSMTSLCSTFLCRSRHVLRYFGLTEPVSGCGQCDNCLRHSLLRANFLGALSARQATLILESMVTAVNQQQLIRHLLGIQHENDSAQALAPASFGAASRLSETGLRMCMHRLTAEGLAVGDSDLQLTDAGIRILDIVRGLSSHMNPAISIGSFLNRKNEAADPPSGGVDPESNDSLLEAELRELRMRVSKNEGIPPFMLLNNQKLRIVANMRPASIAELASMGLNARSIDILGKDIIALTTTL